jgi:Ulp1 family protease
MNPLDAETILIQINPGSHWMLLAIMIKLREIIIVDSQNFDLVDENFRDQE